jgi:hypothetical protein
MYALTFQVNRALIWQTCQESHAKAPRRKDILKALAALGEAPIFGFYEYDTTL